MQRESKQFKFNLTRILIAGLLYILTLGIIGCAVTDAPAEVNLNPRATPDERQEEVQKVPSAKPVQASDLRIEIAEPNSATVNFLVQEAMIEFQSPTGIGTAQISSEVQAFERMEQSLVLRFHLDGLEQLRIIMPKSVQVASISTADNGTIFQERGIIAIEGEMPINMALLDDQSPYWLEVDFTQAQEESSGNGYIDVILPEALLVEADSMFSIEWIDFFR